MKTPPSSSHISEGAGPQLISHPSTSLCPLHTTAGIWRSQSKTLQMRKSPQIATGLTNSTAADKAESNGLPCSSVRGQQTTSSTSLLLWYLSWCEEEIVRKSITSVTFPKQKSRKKRQNPLGYHYWVSSTSYYLHCSGIGRTLHHGSN